MANLNNYFGHRDSIQQQFDNLNIILLSNNNITKLHMRQVTLVRMQHQLV